MWKRRLALAAVFLTVLLFVLIQTATFQQWLLRRIQGVATRANFPFKADKLRLDIFQMRGALDGFVYDKDGTKIRIKHATVDLPWNAFFGDSIVVNSVFADGITVNIQSPEPVVPTPSGEKHEMPKFKIGQLAVHNVDLTYTNQNMLVRIPSFNIDAIDGRGTVKIASPITLTPDTQIALEQIPIMLGTDSAQFGPLKWSMQYSDYSGSGAADGDIKWSPSVAFHLNFSTEPMTIQQWKNLEASGKAGYDDGKLKLQDVRIVQRLGKYTGQLIANAEISDQNKTAALMWSGLRIDPAGVPGATDGTLNVQWKAMDFSDLNGVAVIDVSTRQYGKAHGDAHFVSGKATVDLNAAAMDAKIRAHLIAGMDHTLSGTFDATQTKYGLIRITGNVGGNFENPTADASLNVRNASYEGVGPLNASAKAALRGKQVTVRDLKAQLKNSSIPDGSVRIDLATKHIEGSIPQINLDAHDFAEDVQGKATLSTTLSGTTDKPVAQLQGSSDGLDIGGTHIDSAAVNGRFSNNTLVINRFEARQAEGGLEATGSLNLTSKAIDADAHITNLQIVQVSDLSATANLDAKITGTTTSPVANFKGGLENVVYQGQDHGNINVEGVTENKVATFHVSSDKYNAAADAEVRVEQPYPFKATLTTNNSRIQYDPYNVTANGKASVAGQLQPFDARDIKLADFAIKGNGVDLTANGELKSGVAIKGSADLSQLPVDNVTLTGSAKLDAVVSGDIKNPTVDGSVTTDNATVQTAQMNQPATIQTAVDFNRNEFSIRRMRAELLDAVVSVTGAGSLKGTGQVQFEATNIHPENFLQGRPVSGTVSIHGKVALTSPTVEGISGDAEVTQLDLNLRDVPIHQVQPIQIAIKDQTLSIHNFEVEGAETHAKITGTANLKNQALNVDVEGATNLRILEAFVPGSAAQGTAETRLAIRGTAGEPNITGFLNLADTQIQTANPPLAFSKASAEIRFSGQRVDIARATGELNEGQFAASGGAGLSAEGLKDVSIRLTLKKAQLEYPEGLQSEISSDIQITGTMPNLVAAGDVDIDNAIYQKNIDLSQEIFQRVTSQHKSVGSPVGPQKPSALAEQIRLELQVRTQGPISIVNNMANIDLNGSLRVRGSAADPIILGRAAVEEGGELYFGPGVAAESSVPGERRDRYIIDRGVIDFNNPLQTEPDVDFEATHEMKVKDERYTVTLRAYGTPSRLRTEFTSDPALDEQDIKWMLLTGRTFQEMQGSALAVGEEQLATYFSGRVSGFFETAGSALGLDTVRIEPVALADEQDLGARLTLGKDITKDFSLIYSQSLAGSRSQSWIASYSTWKKLLLRGVNDTEKRDVRFELSQDLRIGGGPPLPKRVAPRNELPLGDVTFVTGLDTAALKKRVTKPGKAFNAYRLNEDVRDLKKFLAKDNRLRARVHGQRTIRDGVQHAQFTIEEGPKIILSYTGGKVPGKIQDSIRQLWLVSLTDTAALQASNNRLLRYLRDEGYLQATVASRETSSTPDERRLLFEIVPGMKSKDPEWIFKGIEPIELPEKAGIVLEQPKAIRDKIEFQLEKQGFLDATSSEPELIFQEDGPKFVVTVERGAQYMVGRIDFSGNKFMEDSRLRHAVRQGPSNPAPVAEAGRPPQTEEELPLFPFTNEWIEKAQQRATVEYWQEGFNDVRITPRTTTDSAKAQVLVHFDVDEGERQMIRAIEINGVELTDMSHVMRYFQFKEGDPVDYTRINLTRKKLYDTTLFKRVDIKTIKGPADGYIAQVNLNESAPWRFRYGFVTGRGTDTSSNDFGISTDLSYGNLFGKGLMAGVAVKETRGLRDARIYGTLPVFLNREIKTTMMLFRTRDLRVQGSISDLRGFTLQQQRRLKNYYILSYDYSLRREHTFDRDPADSNVILDQRYRIGRLNGTLTRDTRDDILNATQGTFFSNALDLAPPLFGSEIRFFRDYVQYFRFKQLSKNRVWANAVRVGAARVFSGTKLVSSEQFLAGGGTTLRAFPQDRLTLSPGNALFVVNSELRFPVAGRFGGVVFFDAGNVYEKIGNLNVFSLRYSPGLGIRVKTPFILLRLDMGLNLWPRTGEQRRHFAFGVGQAF